MVAEEWVFFSPLLNQHATLINLLSKRIGNCLREVVSGYQLHDLFILKKREEKKEKKAHESYLA